MSARDEIAGILEQWLRLTQAEGKAIQAAAWPALIQIQSRKAVLPALLAEATRKCTELDAVGGSDHRKPNPIHAEVARIMSLLTRNGVALAAQLRRAQARRELLGQTDRNLQKIQRSYAQPSPPRTWHSYS